jgi:hypothetical protein
MAIPRSGKAARTSRLSMRTVAISPDNMILQTCKVRRLMGRVALRHTPQ